MQFGDEAMAEPYEYTVAVDGVCRYLTLAQALKANPLAVAESIVTCDDVILALEYLLALNDPKQYTQHSELVISDDHIDFLERAIPTRLRDMSVQHKDDRTLLVLLIRLGGSFEFGRRWLMDMNANTVVEQALALCTSSIGIDSIVSTLSRTDVLERLSQCRDDNTIALLQVLFDKTTVPKKNNECGCNEALVVKLLNLFTQLFPVHRFMQAWYSRLKDDHKNATLLLAETVCLSIVDLDAMNLVDRDIQRLYERWESIVADLLDPMAVLIAILWSGLDEHPAGVMGQLERCATRGAVRDTTDVANCLQKCFVVRFPITSPKHLCSINEGTIRFAKGVRARMMPPPSSPKSKSKGKRCKTESTWEDLNSGLDVALEMWESLPDSQFEYERQFLTSCRKTVAPSEIEPKGKRVSNEVEKHEERLLVYQGWTDKKQKVVKALVHPDKDAQHSEAFNQFRTQLRNDMLESNKRS